MIAALVIALVLLVLLGAVVWFWQRRLHQAARTEFNPVMRPEAPRSTQLRPSTSTLWRPPPRQHLLQQQRQSAAQRGQREGPNQRLYTRRQRVVSEYSDPPPLSSAAAAPERFAHAPNPITLPLEPRAGRVAPGNVSTRLDRKRQGLDSLITEWSSETTDHSTREH